MLLVHHTSLPPITCAAIWQISPFAMTLADLEHFLLSTV
jgi:hypothetical protein